MENDNLQSIFEHPIVQKLAEKAWKDLESEVKLPYVLEDKVLMSPGVWNNFYYNEAVIKAIFEKTNWSDPKVRALFLDHVDDRAAEWIGEIVNPKFKNGNVVGNLAILDKPTAIKLAYGAKFGVSPKVIGEADYNRRMYDGHFENFSIVINPAVKTTFLNSQIKINKNGGKNMPKIEKLEEESEASEEVEEPEESEEEETENVEELAEKVATILAKKKKDEELKKKKYKYPYEQMEKKLAELAESIEELKKKKPEEEEMKKKKDEEELKKKKDEEELKKKKYEYPEEMGEEFATELSAYTDFVKKYLKDHPGASIKEAAKAWGKKHSEELEEVTVPEITIEDLTQKVGQAVEEKMSESFGITPIRVSKRFLEPGAGEKLSNSDVDGAMDRLIRGEVV